MSLDSPAEALRKDCKSDAAAVRGGDSLSPWSVVFIRIPQATGEFSISDKRHNVLAWSCWGASVGNLSRQQRLSVTVAGSEVARHLPAAKQQSHQAEAASNLVSRPFPSGDT